MTRRFQQSARDETSREQTRRDVVRAIVRLKARGVRFEDIAVRLHMDASAVRALYDEEMKARG